MRFYVSVKLTNLSVFLKNIPHSLAITLLPQGKQKNYGNNETKEDKD